MKAWIVAFFSHPACSKSGLLLNFQFPPGLEPLMSTAVGLLISMSSVDMVVVALCTYS